MKVYPIADGHTDHLYQILDGNIKIDAGIAEQFHVSRESLLKGNVRLQFFAAFVDAAFPKNPTVRGLELIDQFRTLLGAWKEDIVEITKENLDDVLNNGPIGAVLTVEGGDILGGSLGVLRQIRKLGVKVMTLVWNHENAIGTPAIMDAVTGLKPFGIECVHEMNAQNMAIDVSHLNTAGFWDAIEHSTQPIIATHSNAKAITNHFRNLDDDQIKAIIAQGGYIGINFCGAFLCDDENNCSLDDIVRHTDHILSLGGEKVLGLGSDWDGITSYPKELHGAQDFQLILERFEKAGYPQEVIEGIAYRNLAQYIKRFL